MDTIDERYKRGKIYIVKCKYDDNLIYVGSTIRKLNRRFADHRCNKDCSLYQYVNGDWDNFYIELYEECPCNNKKELFKREGEVIRLIGTINYRIAGRNGKEYYEDNKEILAEKAKEWREDNKEILAEKKKIYRENNKEKLAEKYKEWYEDNREIISGKVKIYYENNKERKIQYQRIYREANIEKIKQFKNENVKCDNCGDYITRCNLKRHKKSKKCQEHKK